MARETRTGGTKVETVLSPSLHKKFKAKCKRENISMAQHIRDMIQACVKAK